MTIMAIACIVRWVESNIGKRFGRTRYGREGMMFGIALMRTAWRVGSNMFRDMMVDGADLSPAKAGVIRWDDCLWQSLVSI